MEFAGGNSVSSRPKSDSNTCFWMDSHICLTTVPDCSDRLVLFLVLDVDSKIRHHDDLMIKVCKFESQMVRINEARND